MPYVPQVNKYPSNCRKEEYIKGQGCSVFTNLRMIYARVRHKYFDIYLVAGRRYYYGGPGWVCLLECAMMQRYKNRHVRLIYVSFYCLLNKLLNASCGYMLRIDLKNGTFPSSHYFPAQSDCQIGVKLIAQWFSNRKMLTYILAG